jgi:soluble cytochrome b562
MRYFILILALFSLTFTLADGEENTNKKLSPKIEKVVRDAKANILKDYQIEMSKLIKELEKSKVLATKAGNLIDANAIDALIKDISSDSLLTEIMKDNKEVSDRDLLGKPGDESKSIMLGKWGFNVNGSRLLDIAFDGKKGTSSNMQSFSYVLKNGNLEIVWVGGGTWTLKLDPTTQKFAGKDSGGSTVTAEQSN